jgi:hypothetical protein
MDGWINMKVWDNKSKRMERDGWMDRYESMGQQK